MSAIAKEGFRFQIPGIGRATTVPYVVFLPHPFLSRGRFLMSRKSRRNTLKNGAQAERTTALRLPYGTLGLSGLALGSMAVVGAVHAQDASPAGNSTANAAKPKAAAAVQQAKSLRSKVTRLASNALPAN